VIYNLTNLSQQKRSLIETFVEQLSRINGISAIVLGGSYARGTQHEKSDIDIGLYYFPDHPFSINEIRGIAEGIAIDGSATVTRFYEWGAWVNGGAWINTSQGKVDFLYRNLDQVQRTISEARQGISHHDYDQQPTHGFYSVIYLAEIQYCIPLYDPKMLIAKLKSLVEVYPPHLKRKVISDSLWAAEFTLLHARDYAAKGDIYNTAGCVNRVVSNITQALFAINEKYFMGDKNLLDTMAKFSSLPSGYIQQINRILAHPGSTGQMLTKTLRKLEQVWNSVVSLPGVDYKSQFPI
jgi:hypothetical protein